MQAHRPKIQSIPMKNARKESPIDFRSCKLCPYRTKSMFSIIGHLRLHRLRTLRDLFQCHSNCPQNYKCSKCGFETDLKTGLKIHTDTNHSNKKSSDSPKTYKCKGCNFETNSSLVLLRHLTTAANTSQCGMFCCDQPGCGYITSNRAYLKAHCVIHHMPKSETKRYECDQCPCFITNKRTTFMDHALINHADPEDDEWTRCPKCPYQSVYKYGMDFHISSHHNGGQEKKFKWYECDQCSFKSGPQNLFEQHMLSVHDSTGIKCTKCDHKSPNYHSLKSHLYYMHTKPEDVRWFQCEHCSFKFKARGDLKAHMRRKHSSEMFECDYCDYKSPDEIGLGDHVNQRHPDVF